MPTIQYSVKIRKNEGLIISPEELLSIYLHGVRIQSNDGTELSDEDIRFYIQSAQTEVENYFDIRFEQKFINETVTFFHDDYYNRFPILRLKLPIRKGLSLFAFLNGVEQIKYPITWLNTHKDSEEFFYKTLSIVPTGSVASRTSADILLTGITAFLGLTSYREIPEYFDIQYLTGFENVPLDLLNVVGKLASIGLLNIAGDLILGAGIAATGLSIDGLSQNISTTSSATNSGYGARIVQYNKEIVESVKRLKRVYKGINLASL